jgi:hypothetical protein
VSLMPAHTLSLSRIRRARRALRSQATDETLVSHAGVPCLQRQKVPGRAVARSLCAFIPSVQELRFELEFQCSVESTGALSCE